MVNPNNPPPPGLTTDQMQWIIANIEQIKRLLYGINGSGGGGSSILLQTNGANNADQALLNIAEGAGVTLTNVGGTVEVSANAGGVSLPDTQIAFGNPSNEITSSDNFTYDESKAVLVAAFEGSGYFIQEGKVVMGDGREIGNNTKILVDDADSSVSVIAGVNGIIVDPVPPSVYYTGSGVNNMLNATEEYIGPVGEHIDYTISITELGGGLPPNPDKFSWSDGTNSGTDIPLSIGGGVFELSNGVKVTFSGGINHQLDDQWTFSYTELAQNGRVAAFSPDLAGIGDLDGAVTGNKFLVKNKDKIGEFSFETILGSVNISLGSITSTRLRIEPDMDGTYLLSEDIYRGVSDGLSGGSVTVVVDGATEISLVDITPITPIGGITLSNFSVTRANGSFDIVDSSGAGVNDGLTFMWKVINPL